MDWYPQLLFLAEQVAAGVYSFFKTHFFWKGVFWSRQALFTAEQVAAGVFCFGEERHAFFKQVRFSQYLSFVVNIYVNNW